MRIALVFPPQATFFSPHLALPSLTAALKARGHEVAQIDANLEANLWALRTFGSDPVVVRVEDSLSALKRQETYLDDGALIKAFEGIDLGYEAINRRISPARLSHDYSVPYPLDEIAGLEGALADDSIDPFLEYHEHLLSRLEGFDVLGLSLAYQSQLIPGLRLIAAARRRFPNLKIVAGGQMVTRLSSRMVDTGWFLPGVDVAVTHEGERALVEVLSRWEEGAPLAGVSGLLWLEGGSVSRTVQSEGEDLSLLPTPDFSGLLLDEYLSPIRLLPLLTSRGCYWGRCAFCTHSHGYGRFRMRPEALLAADLEVYQRRWGAEAFFLADECVPPKQIRVLASHNAGASTPVQWYGDLRLEQCFGDDDYVSNTLVESGCRMAIFGLESASTQVLKSIDKGGDAKRYSAVLKATHRAGIKNVVMFFSGFPGESLSQAHETLAFVRAHAAEIDGWGNGAFSLQGGSLVHAEPDKFGLSDLRRTGSLSEVYDYRVRRGLNAASASQIAASIRRVRESDPRYSFALPRELRMAQLVIRARRGLEEGA